MCFPIVCNCYDKSDEEESISSSNLLFENHFHKLYLYQRFSVDFSRLKPSFLISRRVPWTLRTRMGWIVCYENSLTPRLLHYEMNNLLRIHLLINQTRCFYVAYFKIDFRFMDLILRYQFCNGTSNSKLKLSLR